MQTIKQIMTKNLITVSPEDTMLLAYQLMYQKNIRHLPVFDGKNLIGLLSDRDVQRAMIVNHPEEINGEIFLRATWKVKEFMSCPIFSVLESMSLKSVIEEIIHMKISAILVQNEKLEYVGIVTTEDILGEFLKVLSKEEEMAQKPLSFFFSNTLY